MNINEKLSSVLEYVRDSTNPYVRLVRSAMTTDRRAVPFYQMEEVREASFQSDHACEMILKALAPSLDEGSTIVVSKALSIFRVLFIEGANGIRIRMAKVRGSLSRIAGLQDVGKGTLEASNRELARALLQAMDGNSEALASFPTLRMSGAGEEEYAPPQSHKSEFQAMHEKERRMYRRQCEEEKKQSAVIVRERVHGTFDGSLSPDKLVEQVVASPKKRFAQAELGSFVSAALATGKVPEVCAALDEHLQGPRQTLQNRYKVLLVVEALLSGGVTEAHDYYRQNSAGICRHLTTNSVENPVKAEAAQSTAHRIMQALRAPMLPSAPAPIAPPRHAITPKQPAVSQLDDLFSDLSVKKTPAAASSSHVPSLQDMPAATVIEDIFGFPQQPRTAPMPPTVSSTGGGGASPAPSLLQLFDWNHQEQQQHQQQQQEEGSQRSVGATAPTLGTPHPPVSSNLGALNGEMWQPPPQQQQQQSASLFMSQDSAPSSGSCMNTLRQSAPTFLESLQGASAAAGGPVPQTTSFGTPSGQHIADSRSDSDKLRLMQQLQAQMEMTRRMLEQQQSALLSLQTEFHKK